MDALAPERPRAVTIVGWIWLVLAVLRFLNGIFGLVVWNVGGLDRGLPFLALRSSQLRIQVLGLETWMGYAPEILVVQVLVAGTICWAAYDLLRLKAWARTTIEAASWLGILLAAAAGAYVFTAAAKIAQETPAEAEAIRMAGAAAWVFVGLLGAAFFGTTIYLLRRPAVGRAFEPAP